MFLTTCLKSFYSNKMFFLIKVAWGKCFGGSCFLSCGSWQTLSAVELHNLDLEVICNFLSNSYFYIFDCFCVFVLLAIVVTSVCLLWTWVREFSTCGWSLLIPERICEEICQNIVRYSALSKYRALSMIYPFPPPPMSLPFLQELDFFLDPRKYFHQRR